jgi:hypothetical protein
MYVILAYTYVYRYASSIAEREVCNCICFIEDNYLRKREREWLFSAEILATLPETTLQDQGIILN